MELFTLGASNDGGYPYSETDVREQARALTGWRADYQDDVGPVNFRFDPRRHDPGAKTIFGQTGAFDWNDSCRLCVEHRAHKTFFVLKLWSYFIAKPPSQKDRKALEALYVKHNYAVKPVVEAILAHPALYRGPSLVKPPIVYIAGLMRARRSGVTRRLGLDRRDRRPARLPPAQRLRLGRGPLARHVDLPRPLDRRQSDRRGELDRPRVRLRPEGDAERGGQEGAQVLGQPVDLGPDPQGPAALRPVGRRRDDRGLAEEHLPGAAPERAADADRDLTGDADVLRSER